MADIHGGFQNADDISDTEVLFNFLDAANASESIRSCRRRMLDRCPPKPGNHILDIGCGIGHGAFDLARKVGRTGSVVGVDKSEALIAEAKRRAERSPAPPRYQVGDARRLDLPGNHFDLCRAERVLMYIETPERAIDEMIRVLRPGGGFALFEFDYDCIVVDAADEELTRRIAQLVSDSIPSPRIGRQLPRLLRARGAEALTIVPHMIMTPLDTFRRVVGGTVTDAVDKGELESADVDQWWRELDRSEIGGRLFAGFFGFVICGRSAAA